MIGSRRVADLERSVDRPVVERDPRERAAAPAGIGQPTLEPEPPLLHRPTPLAVRRDHPRSATRDPRVREPGIHERRQLGEVGVDRRLVGSIGLVRDRVVLIGRDPLLVPRLAAERQPRPGTRRLTEPIDPELQEPPGQGVARHGPDVGDLERLHARIDQIRDHRRRGPAGGDQRLRCGARLHLPSELERRPPLERHQVGVGDDPDDPAGTVGHRHVVDPVLQHHGEHLADGGLVRQRHDRRRNDRRDRLVGAPILGQDTGSQVAVGDDPPAVARSDEQRRDPFPRHRHRGLPDALVRSDRHRRAGEQAADRRRPRVGREPRPGGLEHLELAAPDAPRQERHPVPGREDAFGDLGLEQVTDGLLVGADGEGGLVAGEQRNVPEDLSLLMEVDHVISVQHLDRTGPDDVEEPSGLSTLHQDHVRGREELDPGRLDDLRRAPRRTDRRTEDAVEGRRGCPPGEVSHRPFPRTT